MSDDCLFCKIVKKEIPAEVVYEDDDVLAFLDIKPVNDGHTLVIPKAHYTNLYDIDETVFAKVMSVVKKLAPIIKDATGSDGINLEMNNDRPAGQVIFHAHVHIVPRIDDDGLRHWPGQERTGEQLAQTASTIKNALGK